MRLYFIRHGQTDHNRKQVMQGHNEVPLSRLGIQQAAQVGRRMADVPLETIYASDLRRAAMTATIIAAFTDVPIVYDTALRERHPGELTDKPYEEAMPFFLDRDFQPPGGENYPAFEERVRKVFDTIAEREGTSDRSIAVVSHGMVCGAFLMTYFGYTFEDRLALTLPNTSVTIADYNGQWKLITLADTSHLDSGQLDSPRPVGG